MAEDRSSQIEWREYGPHAFEEAEKEDKLILLDISASWCHWCHVMDRTTYSTPEVINTVNERFIPVRVDADKRPDVQDRYLMGGWPTTAFLVPDGRVLTGTTFIPPQAMIQKLKEVDSMYHEHKEIVSMHVISMEAQVEAERAEAETPAEMLGAEVADSLTLALKDEFDPDNGGFGDEPKFPYPDAARFVFLRYRRAGDREMLNIALKTLDGMMGIHDPVWGGFYRYSVNADWSEPHYEKMLYVQAGALDNYLEAYQVTGDDKYGEVAAGVKAYVNRFLSDSERGGFYSSQDADVNSHDPYAPLVLGEDYFPKNEEERLAVGLPYVDKTVFTDMNGMMISSYLRLYHVMGDKPARDFALMTVDRLLSENLCDGRMCHYFDGESRLPNLLADQVYFAQALVDAYQSSGVRRYLKEAEKLVQFMSSELQDVVDGGFYFRTFDPHAKGELLERHKPFDENVTAAGLLTDLARLTGNQDYHDLAERTLRAIAYPQIAESIIGMGFGVALDKFIYHPMHVVLVGDKDADQTRAMLEASLHTYEPGKLVQVLDPEEEELTIGGLTYEPAEEPVAYVCVQNVCRPPAKGKEALVAVLEDVFGGMPS